jgi:serine/threonine-protein kinase
VPGLPDDLTMGATAPSTPTPSASRFAPGSIIAGRYRLVALLGRGGMGEVYRADDLTLDQPVALKFLTEGAAGDQVHLAQFHNELRTARQVSHKNVCRLYDLGEAGGRRFLTMEYVDGEDLASLLRRIGRIPQDKAIELARQLCAGVAAAHERGVLHRDLKPANVMIDGDGNVRITDFGIATSGADTATGFAGTPQYMAPEQLAGQPASIRTDLYALGLVLFEIFTGRRVYDAKTLGDLKQLHDTGSVTTPSSVVRDLDPTVERVILRCLDKDPQKRPGSALAVAAAMPGGDPLAAALAAGETPSPAMLVAAGETDALDVRLGLAAVAFVVAGVILVASLSARTTIAGRVPLDKPPAVLADRAQQILQSLGYTDPPADSAYDFAIGQVYLRWIAMTDQRPERWDQLKTGNPPGLLFWHRTSPRLLIPQRSQAQVTTNDPTMAVSGMTLVMVDTLGRLMEFQAVPPQIDADGAPAPPPQWEPLFAAAGLNLAAFTPVTPRWSPRDFADTRAAWDGPMPDRPDIRLHVEAAAYRGRPVSMFVLGPWSVPTRMAPLKRTTPQVVLNSFSAIVIVALVIAALLIARHNLRAQRADRRGAARLATFVLVGYAMSWVIAAHHVPDVTTELNIFSRSYGPVLLSAGVLWLIYLALEPYVRRFWPDGILGWTRLMSGYVRDPLVGRDVLLGCVFAVGLTLLEKFYFLLPPLIGRPSAMPLPQYVGALIGGAALLSTLFDVVASGLFPAMFAVLGYVLLRLAFRRTVFAVAAAFVLLFLVQAQQVLTSAAPMWIALLFQLSLVAIVTTVVVRYGLLVTAIASSVGSVLGDIPMTTSLWHWTATTSNLTIAIVLALVFFGFYASRAGQPLFGTLEVKN